MKTLFLILTVTLAASAQELVSPDGTKWLFIATVKDGDTKLDLYARTPFDGTRKLPRLTVKAWGGPESIVSLDCKRGMVRANKQEWVKAPPKSFGRVLLKFACK